MSKKASSPPPPNCERPTPPPAPPPPLDRRPDVWILGGTPGWGDVQFERWFDTSVTEKDIITQAADTIERNAEALRHSSTIPGTDNWPDETDRDQYAHDMHLVQQLRKLVKEKDNDY